MALDDPELRRVFQGVYPADKLPPSPPQTVRAAYIVNTDPAGEPGQHWLGIWTEQNKCEIFDSYGLPLHVYKNAELHKWWSQWKYLTRSDITLQAMDRVRPVVIMHYFSLKPERKDRPTRTFWEVGVPII